MVVNVPEVKITKMVILFFFSRETRLKNHQFIHKIHESLTFDGPFVIDKNVGTVQMCKYNTCIAFCYKVLNNNFRMK